jgi:2,4-dienoyl-CoA reductase (NADPH2)
MTALWRPGAIGSLALPHRIVMGSMHLGCEADDDAGATLGAFYAERARGGAGLIVTGGSAVSRVGAGGASYGFVNEDAGARALEEVASAVHAEGGLVALQLFHAGRYAFEETFGLTPVAPSAVFSRFSRATPAALDEDGVLAVIDEFVAGAVRARELGFDAVEVMGSEGYLVDQFLSPLTNHRDDDWGGDTERRRRFGVELTRAIRAAVGPAFPLIFRFTGLDLMPGSTTPDEVLAFAGALADAGADALNVGIGWHEAAVPTVQGAVPPGAWWSVGEAVAGAVDVPVIAGNRVDTVERAASLLDGSAVAFASMARPFLADAALIERSRAGRPVDPCIACNQACIDRSIVDGRVSCMVNPRAGRERTFVVAADPPCGSQATTASGGRHGRAPVVAADPPCGSQATTVVVGGGPAGLEAARALATLGVRVRLLEAEDELGGQFRYARLVPGKEQFGGTIEYFARELERLGVDVRLSHSATADDLGQADAVVLATGVKPRTAGIEGEGLDHVVDYQRAFTKELGETVAILGAGGIGVDLAHRLTDTRSFDDAVAEFRTVWGLEVGAAPEAGREVTLMRRTGRIGSGMGRTTRWVSVAALKRAGVDTRTDVIYKRIEPSGVRLQGDELVEANTVVIAAGQMPNADLLQAVEALNVPFRVIGGARDADRLDAVRAFSEGLEAAYALAAELGCDNGTR